MHRASDQSWGCKLISFMLSRSQHVGLSSRAHLAHMRRSVSEHELQEVVARVCAQEVEDDIPQWTQADAPASVLPPDQLPKPGRVVSRRELPVLGATELVLSNGMRVCTVLCHIGCSAGSCLD